MNRVKLSLLCGIPGSGKTTYAEKYIESHPGTVHLSSDKIRKELWGDEATQGDNNEVFYRMQRRAIDGLNFGYSVIYDATNVTRKDRAGIIAACPKFVQIECHVVWAPIETCIERDAARKRTVGKAVIDKMLKRFQPPYYDEGIHEIKIALPDGFIGNDYENKCMENMDIPHDNPHHTLNVLNHSMAAVQYAIDKQTPMDVKIAALYHDIGKPYVKAFVDSKGNECETAHYYQHHCVGAWMAYGLEVDLFVVWLIGAHMEPFGNTKYYNKLPSYLKTPLDQLHECDLNAH